MINSPSLCPSPPSCLLNTPPSPRRTYLVKGKKIDPKKITEKEKIRKIFVGGVALDTPEEEVKAHFEQFGAIEEIVFPTNKETKQRKGFCFITFVDPEACDQACSKQNAKQQIGPKMCDVKKVLECYSTESEDCR